MVGFKNVGNNVMKRDVGSWYEISELAVKSAWWKIKPWWSELHAQQGVHEESPAWDVSLSNTCGLQALSSLMISKQSSTVLIKLIPTVYSLIVASIRYFPCLAYIFLSQTSDISSTKLTSLIIKLLFHTTTVTSTLLIVQMPSNEPEVGDSQQLDHLESERTKKNSLKALT